MTLAHTVDIQVIFRKHFRTLVYGLTRSIENTTQHVFCHGKLHTASGELDMRGFDVYAGCAFENLDNGLLALHLEHLTTTFRAIWQRQLDNFVV